MVVRLSALRTGYICLTGNTPGTHFCYTLSRPQDLSAIGRISCKWNIHWHQLGSKHDLPICSTALSRRRPEFFSPPGTSLWIFLCTWRKYDGIFPKYSSFVLSASFYYWSMIYVSYIYHRRQQLIAFLKKSTENNECRLLDPSCSVGPQHLVRKLM